MRLLIGLVVAASITRAISSPPYRSAHVLKDRHPVPPKWKKVSRADGDGSMQLMIGLRQGRFKELEYHLYESMNLSTKTFQ
jgi:tripeptidyl-peptidase-1